MANIPQTTVDATQPIGMVGQLADFQSNADASVDTATSEESSASIPFGAFVCEGAADDGALLMHSAADVIKGIVTHSHGFERLTELAADGLKPLATFGVLAKGRVYVIANTDIVKGSEVHVCYATNSGYTIGQAGAAPVTNKTLDISAWARWKTTGVKGTVLILEIDLANRALTTADT